MQNAKASNTHFAAHFKLFAKMSPQTEEEEEFMSRVPYSNVVGSLMYAMVCTRLNIAHSVSVASHYMANPGKAHWQAVKWILRYLKGSIDIGLVFGRGTNRVIGHVIGFCDSDCASDLNHRRFLHGYIFTLGGSAISWRATLQSTITL